MSESSQQSRTEQATPRRLERAQQEGQVAYSTDLSAAIMLLIATLMLAIFSDYFLGHMTGSMSRFLLSIKDIGHDKPNWSFLFSNSVNDFFMLSAPLAILALFSTLGIAGMMTGFKTSPKAMKFDVNRLNPASGVKKIFSMRALIRGLLAIGKLTVLTTIVIVFVYWKRADFLLQGSTSINTLFQVGWNFSVNLALAISLALVVIGLIDFLFQKWKHSKDVMMSRQELVDERREDEGDPYMRARLRKIQREMAQRQNLDDVRTATVVVTNPTHFAVALTYDRDSMSTPKVVAKGVDHMAKKIISIAKDNNVAVVERKPLARALYRTVAVGDDISLELFQAVAEVIAYVYQLQRAA